MKTFKTIATLLLCLVLLFGATSCVVLVKKDNGYHKGWFKNPNNPHHPYSTNPGKSKGNFKK
ncbi:MAG: hypothetical protein NTX93_01475 [Bacteroidia bacterium]|nr:hypothetical protein [Bacteroidia bacterium]